MMLLLNHIPDYEKKAEFLKDNGWVTWYHNDNWVKKEWFDNPTFKIDMAGISTEMALKREGYNDRIIQMSKLMPHDKQPGDILESIKKHPKLNTQDYPFTMMDEEVFTKFDDMRFSLDGTTMTVVLSWRGIDMITLPVSFESGGVVNIGGISGQIKIHPAG